MTIESSQISSLQNQRVKHLVLLQQKSSERRKTGLFVVEGQREIAHCIEGGYQIDSIYCCPRLCGGRGPSGEPLGTGAVGVGGLWPSGEPLGTGAAAFYPELVEGQVAGGRVPVFQVTEAVYEKIAYRGSTEGVLAVVKSRPLTLDELEEKEAPPYVVLESVEKPGNLGAVLRSADAAAADAVIVCDPLTDLYNPNLIRSSIGAVFTVPCVACTSEECIAFLKSRGIRILTAQLQDSHLYYDTDMRQGTAIVMGTESTGLTDAWRQAADAHIRIPMMGRLDSLNVSVSAAILLFEAVRQRQATGRA